MVELPLEVRATIIGLERRASGGKPLALNAFGIAQLLTGESEKAVATLERAVRLGPKDPRLLSDMAAAYLVRSLDADRFEDAARAVGFAQRATDANPQLAEARFNLALSLERLSLRGEARKAWQSYLKIDRTSPWAGEASRHLARLAESPEQRWENQRREIISAGERGDDDAIRNATKRFPDTAYDYVESDLVPAWADAWLARDPEEVKRTAQLARRFGQALADIVGERMALDAALAIERVQISGDQQRTDALARGHQIFREGRALYEQDKVAASAEHFGDAHRAFLACQSPFTEWASLQLAIWHYYRNDFEESTRLLDALVRESSAQSHLRLLGRVQWMKGLIYYIKGQVSDSLDSYREALSVFDRIRAVDDQASLHSRIAENLEAVGDLSAAWVHRKESLARLDALRVARHRGTILSSVAKMARRSNLLDASISVHTELIADAQRSGLAAAVVEGFLGRSEVSALANDLEGAAHDIAEAEHWLPRIPDEAIAGRQRAETMLAKGQILQSTDPVQAMQVLRESFEYFRQKRMELRLPRVNLPWGGRSLLRAIGKPRKPVFWKASRHWKHNARDCRAGNCGWDTSNSRGTCSTR
jgi:tetratricopeptide (TPR) repeat protein